MSKDEREKTTPGMYGLGDRILGYYRLSRDASIHDMYLVDFEDKILLVDVQDAVAYHIGGSLIGDPHEFYAEEIEERMEHVGLRIIEH